MEPQLLHEYSGKHEQRGCRTIHQEPVYQVAGTKQKEHSSPDFSQEIPARILIENPLYHLLFTNQFYMGMRIGETLALTWEDVDLENNTIAIKKTWSKDLHKITTPKTPNSYRTITMPQFLSDEYREFKEMLDVPEKSFVFGIDIPVCNTTVRTRMREAIKIANENNEEQIPIIRIHDLRHSCASYMIGNMVRDGSSHFSLYDVAKRLGDNLSTVLSVYAHWLPQADKGIAKFMDKDNLIDALD